MKKLTEQQRMYLVRHAARLHKRHLNWKEWRRDRRSQTIREVRVYRDGKEFSAIARRSIPLPETLCLDTNCAATLRFLDRAWDDVLKMATRPKQTITRSRGQPPTLQRYYDFTTLRHVSPAAALVMASLFQRSKSITGYKLSTIDEHKWDPVAAWVLRELGFHELLEMRPLRDAEEAVGDLRILRFKSGTDAAGEPPGRLQEALVDLLPDVLREDLMTAEPYGGMFEAILNSHSWAYPADHKWEYPILPNWWITGAVNSKTNAVTVCVFDQGVSIPVSLPRWTHWNALELRGKRLVEKLKLSRPIDHYSNDGLAIQLAMKISRTRTQLPQHGKGLHTMIEVAQRARHGRLRILSRHGEYIWETGRKPRSMTHEHPLRGTLVEWQLQL